MTSRLNILLKIPFYFFKILRYLETKSSSLYYRSIASIHPEAQLLKYARVENISQKKAAIKVGSNTIINGELLTFGHGGDIEIGEWCYVGEGSRIWSTVSIKIGNRVLISHNVNIHDTNSHPLNAQERHQHFVQIAQSGHPRNIETLISKPIAIEDDVWIGFNSTILKGVTIGKGSIIACGSIVTKDIPPNSLFVHNQVRRTLYENC